MNKGIKEFMYCFFIFSNEKKFGLHCRQEPRKAWFGEAYGWIPFFCYRRKMGRREISQTESFKSKSTGKFFWVKILRGICVRMEERDDEENGKSTRKFIYKKKKKEMLFMLYLFNYLFIGCNTHISKKDKLSLFCFLLFLILYFFFFEFLF